MSRREVLGVPESGATPPPGREFSLSQISYVVFLSFSIIVNFLFHAVHKRLSNLFVCTPVSGQICILLILFGSPSRSLSVRIAC